MAVDNIAVLSGLLRGFVGENAMLTAPVLNSAKSGSSKRKTLAIAMAAGLIVAGVSQRAHASLAWDADGSPPANGGTGNWSPTAGNLWLDSADNTEKAWIEGSDAVLPQSGSTNAITIPSGETRTANSLTYINTSNSYTIQTGTLSLTNASPNSTTGFIVMPNILATQAITAPLVGGNITEQGNFSNFVGASPAGVTNLLTLGNANNSFTSWTLGGTGVSISNADLNRVNFNVAGALPSGATVSFQRNFSQAIFTSGNTVPAGTLWVQDNNFVINSAAVSPTDGSGNPVQFQSYIGGTDQNLTIRLDGVISSNGTASNVLNFAIGTSGGQSIVLLNNANTYSGITNILSASAGHTGVVRLGTSGSLPSSTVLSFSLSTAATNVGAFDLNGHTQTVGGLESFTTGGITGLMNSDTTSTAAAPAVLNIGGTNVGSYKGPIGSPVLVGTATGENVATNNKFIRLQLAATNTGTLALTSTTSDYVGGTVVSGGALFVDAVSDIVNNKGPVGTGSVTVNSGGRLGGTGSTLGAVTANGTAVISPGDPTAYTSAGVANSGIPNATPVATLGIGNGLTLDNGNRLEFDISSTSNDKIAVTGDLTLSSSGNEFIKINELAPGAIVGGTTYQLITYSGALVNAFNFAIDPNSSAPPAGYMYVLHNDSQAVDLEVALAPEPGSMMVCGLAGLWTLGKRQRRAARPM
jgi:hypothetical protein